VKRKTDYILAVVLLDEPEMLVGFGDFCLQSFQDGNSFGKITSEGRVIF
jgi:hypothetical protein